jgi:intracellular septation protein A
MKLPRSCPNPYNSRLNFFGGLGLVVGGQVFLLWGLTSSVYTVTAMVVTQLCFTAGGLMLLALSTDRVDLASEQFRNTRRVAAGLFFAGMFAFTVIDYMMNPATDDVFQVLRWALPMVLLMAILLYNSRTESSAA